VAVGQIVSSDVEPERRRARGALLRIRLLSSIGHYRQGTIKSAKGIYHLDEQLAFVAVQTNEQRDHAYWSELTLFAFEEIRFLSALLLSMRPDYGVLRLYPGGAHVTEVVSNEVDLHQLAGNLAMSARSAVAVPLTGGRPYSVSDQEIDTKLYNKLVASISIRDHLMMRGLSAILKADMLQVTRELFRVFYHSRIRRGQIGEVGVNGLQQTEFSSDDVRHFSGSKERHVAQKVKLLCAREHAVVLLAPFQGAEGCYPSWKAIQITHQTARPT
jgi:hypothetical protein